MSLSLDSNNSTSVSTSVLVETTSPTSEPPAQDQPNMPSDWAPAAEVDTETTPSTTESPAQDQPNMHSGRAPAAKVGTAIETGGASPGSDMSSSTLARAEDPASQRTAFDDGNNANKEAATTEQEASISPSWQSSIEEVLQREHPGANLTIAAAHALGAFLEDIGTSLAHAAVHCVKSPPSHADSSCDDDTLTTPVLGLSWSEYANPSTETTGVHYLYAPHVEEGVRAVMGKGASKEMFEHALMAGIKAVKKTASAMCNQATRSFIKSSATSPQSDSPLASVTGDFSSSDTVNLGVLSLAGPLADMHVDVSLAEELLFKATADSKPQSQAGNNPEVISTTGAAVYLDAVLEYAIYIQTMHSAELINSCLLY